jgi:hypothetical protein
MKNSYFLNQILPGFFFKRAINNCIEAPVVVDAISREPEITPVELLDIGPDKSVLVITGIKSKEDDGISEQSMNLLKKIFLSLNIQDIRLHFYLNCEPSTDKLTLIKTLQSTTRGHVKLIFLIGSTVTQHFLGQDKKISQIQGQIFDFQVDQDSFYFIPLYHPDFIALNSSIKNLTWESIKKLRPWLEQQLPRD